MVICTRSGCAGSYMAKTGEPTCTFARAAGCTNTVESASNGGEPSAGDTSKRAVISTWPSFCSPVGCRASTLAGCETPVVRAAIRSSAMSPWATRQRSIICSTSGEPGSASARRSGASGRYSTASSRPGRRSAVSGAVSSSVTLERNGSPATGCTSRQISYCGTSLIVTPARPLPMPDIRAEMLAGEAVLTSCVTG